MRRLGGRVLVAVFVLAAPGVVCAQEALPPDRETFLALERSILNASASKDRESLERFVAPGFVLRASPDVDRATWLRTMASGCWGPRFDIGQFAVRPLGDSVGTSFLLTLYQDPETCRPVVFRSLVTSVWVRGDGHFRLALRQSMPVATIGAQWVRQQFTRESERPPRFDGKAQLSFIATAGNASTQTIGTGGEFGYRGERWTAAMKASFVSTKTATGAVAQSLGFDLRESYRAANSLEAYGHQAFVRDEFAGIRERYTADAGFAYPVVRKRAHSMKIDLGFGYTREARFSGPSPTFPSGVLSAVYAWTISRSSSLNNDTRVTGNLQQAGDWRLTNSFSVTVGLSRQFALKFSDKLSYLNRPVPGFSRADTILSAALVLQLSR
jgi:putative salt-induced outer membrane protein YdiY